MHLQGEVKVLLETEQQGGMYIISILQISVVKQVFMQKTKIYRIIFYISHLNCLLN